MEEAIIGARIRNILEQKIMGAGDMEGAIEDLTEMMGGIVLGAYGTRRGALKGWKTRRANLKKKKRVVKRKISGSKTSKKKSKKIGSVKRRLSCKVGSKKPKRKGDVSVGGSGYGTKKGARKNPWLIHLAKYRKAHPNMLYSDVMQKARKSYKPKK